MPGYGKNPDGSDYKFSPNTWGEQKKRLQAEEDKSRADAMAAVPGWLSEDLSPTNRLPWQRDFDQSIVGSEDGNVKGLIGEQIDRAYSSLNDNPNGYLQTELGRGVPAEAAGLQVDNVGAFNPMGDALAKKYSRQAGDKLKTIQTGNKLDTKERLSKDLGRVGNELGARERLKMQNFKEQYEFQEKRRALYNQWVAANDAAKAQFLGSVFGVAGQAAGAAIAMA